MRTPWGASDGVYPIAPGVVGVTTPSHGGILVDTSVFDLDPRLRSGLFTPPFMTTVPFEEDVDVAALIYRHPELLPKAIRAGYFGPSVTIESITRVVERWHPRLIATSTTGPSMMDPGPTEWCLHCGSDTCEHAARHNAAYGGAS